MSNDLHTQLRFCIRCLLRPVAKLCVKYALRIQEIQDLLKKALLDVAQEELSKEGHRVNISRLALATGLQRKDIQRLKEMPAISEIEHNLLSRVVGLWQANKKFQDIKGSPRPLGFEGATSEFAQLVQKISTDLNSYTVLFEMERVGLVKRNADKLELCANVYQIDAQTQKTETYQLLAADCRDLVSAVEHNIENSTSPYLHARTEYDNIAPEDLPTIKEWILDRGSIFHREVREYLAKFDRDSAPKQTESTQQAATRARVSVGTFSFSEIQNNEN